MARSRTDEDWVERVRRLEAEIAGLQKGMRTRGLIEQAKGRLAERLGIDPEDAFAYLARMSQSTNVKLVDLAADVVGGPNLAGSNLAGSNPAGSNLAAEPAVARPLPTPGRSQGFLVRPGATVTPGATMTSAAGGQSETPTAVESDRRLRRFKAAANAATDLGELINAVADAGGWLGAQVVALFAVEAGGSHRLIAARGWSDRITSDWERVPSAVSTPAATVIRTRQPLWLSSATATDLVVIGPGAARAALPLLVDGTVLGALEVVWLDCADVDDLARRHLRELAALTAVPFANLLAVALTGTSSLAEHRRWVEAALDASVAPGLLLSPVCEQSGAICDFVVDYANSAAIAARSADARSVDARSVDAAGPIGRRLLDTDPTLLTDGGFSALVDAYDLPDCAEGSSGRPDQPGTQIRWRARRVGGQLVATWQPALMQRDYTALDRVALIEQLGGFGWAEWDEAGEPLMWSPGLYRVLGLDPNHGPLALPKAFAAVAEEDRPTYDLMLTDVLQHGSDASVELRLIRDRDEPRHVRISVAARPDRIDGPRGIITLVQDVTDTRLRVAELARAADRLATQRIQVATQRAQTEELRTALFPTPEIHLTHGCLSITARHAAPSSFHRFRGDFYEINQVGDALFLIVGDVFGSGVGAAKAMIRLRHTARALALAGLSPAEMLDLLNRELCGDQVPPLASAVVAKFEAGGSTVYWAQAGHYSPILIRGDQARSLRRPRGHALGLLSDTRYAQVRVDLCPADLLVFYTDGVLANQDTTGHPVRRLATSLLAALRTEGAAALIDHFLRPTQDEACLVTAEWPASNRLVPDQLVEPK